MMKENGYKIFLGNELFDKRFPEQKNCSANFLQRGKACAIPFEFLLVGRQTSRESGEIPPDQRPVRVCMVDYLKSGAANREEVYLRRTF